jgi:hypothetical protein
MIVRYTNDFDASFEYEEDTVLIVSSIEEDFTGLRVAPRTKRGKPLDLRAAQRREHGVRGLRSFRHSFSNTS